MPGLTRSTRKSRDRLSCTRSGLIGYPVWFVGTILAMRGLTGVTHGTGLLALVPGGLSELILPIRFITSGSTFPGEPG
jgi:hypothetical protein